MLVYKYSKGVWKSIVRDWRSYARCSGPNRQNHWNHWNPNRQNHWKSLKSSNRKKKFPLERLTVIFNKKYHRYEEQRNGTEVSETSLKPPSELSPNMVSPTNVEWNMGHSILDMDFLNFFRGRIQMGRSVMRLAHLKKSGEFSTPQKSPLTPKHWIYALFMNISKSENGFWAAQKSGIPDKSGKISSLGYTLLLFNPTQSQSPRAIIFERTREFLEKKSFFFKKFPKNWISSDGKFTLGEKVTLHVTVACGSKTPSSGSIVNGDCKSHINGVSNSL